MPWRLTSAADVALILVLERIVSREFDLAAPWTVLTLEQLKAALENADALKVAFTVDHVRTICDLLVCDGKLLRDDASGGYRACVAGTRNGVSVKIAYKPNARTLPPPTALTLGPCYKCARRDVCNPRGHVSPATCQYYEAAAFALEDW